MENFKSFNVTRNLEIKDLIDKGFVCHLERRLMLHSVAWFPNVPKVNAGFWECAVVNVLSWDMGLGEVINDNVFDFVYGSHAVGTDLTCPSLRLPRISCKAGDVNESKAGDVNESNSIVLSSYRTTKMSSFQEKLDHISGAHEDYIFCLPSVGLENYRLVILKSLNKIFPLLSWGETISKKGRSKGKTSGYKGTRSLDSGVDYHGLHEAKIVAGTSDQLWFKLNLDEAQDILEYDQVLRVKTKPSRSDIEDYTRILKESE